MRLVPLARFASTFMLTLLLAASLAAQRPAAITVGLRDSMPSAVLHEERKLEIYLPDGYASSGSARYPVIYLLDGDGHFHHTTGILQFLVANNLMPPVILVAIPNTDRTRDLTPETGTDSLPELQTAGGGQNFLQFMRDELFPRIEGRYRTVPFRILIGHSFGGLLAVEALQTHPDMFRGYIVISPSLWWNGMLHANRAAADLRDRPDLRAWVYMTTGNKGGAMLRGAQKLADAFGTDGPPGLQWKFVHMPEESHGSIPHLSTYNGLEFIFSDMRMTTEQGRTLLADGLAGYDRYYRQLSDRYGYTLQTPEATINQLGYYYLQSGRREQAIVTFRENVRRFPQSANTYDSLGDAYAAANKLSQAIEAYHVAIEVGTPIRDEVVPVSQRKLAETEQKLHAARGTVAP